MRGGRIFEMRKPKECGQGARGPVQPALHTFLTPTSPTFSHTGAFVESAFERSEPFAVAETSGR